MEEVKNSTMKAVRALKSVQTGLYYNAFLKQHHALNSKALIILLYQCFWRKFKSLIQWSIFHDIHIRTRPELNFAPENLVPVPEPVPGYVTGTGTCTRLCHWYLSRKCAYKTYTRVYGPFTKIHL